MIRGFMRSLLIFFEGSIRGGFFEHLSGITPLDVEAIVSSGFTRVIQGQLGIGLRSSGTIVRSGSLVFGRST